MRDTNIMPTNRTETAYSPRSTTAAQRAEQTRKTREASLNELLAAIAKEHLPQIETLEPRNRDCLDFVDCYVGSIKAALKAAYEAGRKAR